MAKTSAAEICRRAKTARSSDAIEELLARAGGLAPSVTFDAFSPVVAAAARSRSEDAAQRALPILEGLTKRADERWVPFLISVAGGKRAGDPLVGDWCIKALGTIGDPRAAEPLSELLRAGRVESFDAIEALGELGDPVAVPAILGAVSDNPSTYAVSIVRRALSRLPGPETLALIEARLAKPCSRKLKDCLKAALEEVAKARPRQAKSQKAPKARAGRPPDKAREQLLATNDWGVMEKVVAATMERGPKFAFEAFGPLWNEAAGDEDSTHEKHAHVVQRGLEHGADKRWVNLLLADLGKNESRVVDAVDALGRLGDRKVVPTLRRMLGDECFEYASPGIMRALGSIGDPSAVPAVLDALEDQHYLAYEKNGYGTEALLAFGDVARAPIAKRLAKPCEKKLESCLRRVMKQLDG